MPGCRKEFCCSRFPLYLVLAISLLLAQRAIGQSSYTAQVRGIVTNPTGAVIVNATVTITNDGINISTVAHTDERGLYLLSGLCPNTYTIQSQSVLFPGRGE